MNWLLDAHIPPSLAGLMAAAGEQVLHTSDLPGHNATQDAEICRISLADQRIVVTKDSDFYHSFLLKSEPWKLLLVRTDNMGLHAFTELFMRQSPVMLTQFSQHSLIEFHAEGLRILQ
ncbi:MAG: DUF5615 family PIN-like protein [Bacteroidia bacterium]|nr:DUF5615 family PIN-like protein [Bacteroidia bacterium]